MAFTPLPWPGSGMARGKRSAVLTGDRRCRRRALCRSGLTWGWGIVALPRRRLPHDEKGADDDEHDAGEYAAHRQRATDEGEFARLAR